MKFLLEVGHQLDLNVNWDGGGVDNVTYQVSAGSEDVISVTSGGIVEGLMAGVGVVEFVNSNVVVGSAIFEVLTAAQMISRQALRDGTSTLVVEADEVVQTPVVAKISPTLNQFYEVGPAGYVFFAGNVGPGFNRGAGVAADGSNNVGRYDYLWDGELNSYWYAQSSQGAVGYLSEFSTTLKQVKIWSNHQNLTARPTQVIVYGSNVEPTSYAGGTGTPPFALGNDTGWTQIASENITWGNTVSELRTIDVSANTVAYKHYKLALICGEAYVALGGIELLGLS